MLLVSFNMDNGAANKKSNAQEVAHSHLNQDQQVTDEPNHDQQASLTPDPVKSALEQAIDTENASSQENRAAFAARLRSSQDVELYVFDEASTSSSTLADVSSLNLEVEDQESIPTQQVTFKSEKGRLLLLLPPAAEKSFTPVEWEELCQQIKRRLDAETRFFQPDTTVHLIARDRLLDSRQMQQIDELLQTAELRMKRVYTQRRQTAVAAATAGYSVEQQTKLEHLSESPGKALASPLYSQMTVRSGTELRHPGSIVVLGDVNPGGSLIAEGDIFVWGRLRGVAHAGSKGNATCRIMALHMQPTQLRIADYVARAPEKPPALYQPEVAYVNKNSIRIAIASEFAQVSLNSP